jgi:hypothetical protein
VTLTPQIAQRLFAVAPTENWRPDRVNKFAAIMKAGQWHPGSEILWQNDKLADGRYRLLAVIESGCTIEVTLLAKDCDPPLDLLDDAARQRHRLQQNPPRPIRYPPQ